MTGTERQTEVEQTNEESALLSQQRPTTSGSHASFISQTNSPKKIITILVTIIFVLQFGGLLMAVPSIRLFEDIICHHYYENLEGEGHVQIGLDDKIDESLCKVDEVQNQLNVLLAGLQLLGAIPGLVTTIPYGLLADRMGRKFVFILSLCGLILAGVWDLSVMRFWRVLPIRLIWLSPAFAFIGGGEAVTGMMFYAIGSDITTESNRANVFLLGASAYFAAELIAPSIASASMEKSPWIPLLIGLGAVVCGTCLAIFIPETLYLHPSESTRIIPDSSSLRSASSSRLEKSNIFTVLKTHIVDGTKRIYESMTILHSLPVLLLLIAFIPGPFAKISIGLSIRYISNRFSWKLRQVGFLLSLRALVNIILLLGILPAFSYYLTERLHFSSKAKDLSLARFSVTMLVIGSLLFAASPTVWLAIAGMVVLTLGTGFGALTRSLISTLVDKEHIARLYAAIAVVETASALVAGPSLAALYAVGMKLKGPWVGLPFYGLAVICFFGGLGVWCFGFLTKKEEGMRHGDDNSVSLEDDAAEENALNLV